MDPKRHEPRLRAILGTLVLGLSWGLAVPGPAAVPSPDRRAERLGDAIARGADYLVRQSQADGWFRYRVHLDPAVNQSPRYNILRHAGTMHALLQFYERTPDPEVLEILRLSGTALRSCVEPVPEDPRLLAVWPRPEIESSSQPRQAKLGATGLGLVALTGLERIDPGFTPLENLRRMGAFVLFMQKDDGSFHSKYFPDSGGRSDEWTSMYYPGEAALGLLMLHEVDPSARWLRGASTALEYLARRSREQPELLPSQWDLLAIERLLPLMDDTFPIATDRDALLEHARMASEMMLAHQQPLLDHPLLDGCYTDDGRCCPTATRVEGLLAAAASLPLGDAPLRSRIRASLDRGIGFLLRCQVAGGPYDGGIARVLPGYTPDRGEPDSRAGELRIDYVQHALSAMLVYDALTRD